MVKKRLMYWGPVFLLAVSLPGLALAQITVSGGGLAGPSSVWGRTETRCESGPFTIPIGVTGGPQVWDFSALTGAEEEYTETMEDPSGKPSAEFFPDANLCSVGELLTYFRASASGLEWLGHVEGGDHMVLTPPLLVFRWPLTFGAAWTTSGEGTTDEEEGTVTWDAVVDAWGTVKVPAGTFECLRIRPHMTEVWPDGTEEGYSFHWLREDGVAVAWLWIVEWQEDPNFSVSERVDVLKSVTGGEAAVSGSSWGAIKSLFH